MCSFHMLDRKEHWFCLEPAGHARVKIHIVLIRINSSVAQWEVDPSESTQPRNALSQTFHCEDEIKAVESSSPAQGWGHCESKPCQDTQVNVHSWQQGDAGPVLIQRGTSFWPPTCLSQWADCGGSSLKSVTEMKGSSPGSEKWWMKSLSFTLVWNSIWLEGTFVQSIYFKKRNQFQPWQCSSSSNI